MKQFKSTLPIILFILLSLIIIFPLLPPGYILTLDIPATEKAILPSVTSSGFVIGALFYLFHFLLPNYLLQKMLLFITLFISGWGMYRLVPAKNNLAKVFAGLLYMVNPFTYERLMSGQWLLVLSYAILPIFIKTVSEYFSNPTLIRTIFLAFLTAILATLSLHFLFMAGLFFLIYLVVLLVSDRENYKKILVTTRKYLVVTLLLNLNWIIGFIIVSPDIVSSLSFFTRDDLISFQSVADPAFGLLFNLLAGFGFWAEANNYFISSKTLFPIWPVAAVIFIGLFLYGFYSSMVKKRQLVMTITLGVFFLLAVDFALGVASKHFAEIVFFLYDKIVFLRGFREPQKLIAIVFFCYAYFGAVGFEEVISRLSGIKKIILSTAILILPIVYTLPIFWSFWGQLRPVWYPQSWYEVNNLLVKDKDNFLTLFFPWHQYMRFNFTNNKVVVSPAPYFFDKPILSSQNYETIPLYTHDTRPEALHVEGLLSIEKEGVNLLEEEVEEKITWGETLSPINVKYIILAKDNDWEEYGFLERASDLEKAYDGENITLYKNLSWGKEIRLPDEIDNSLE